MLIVALTFYQESGLIVFSHKFPIGVTKLLEVIVRYTICVLIHTTITYVARLIAHYSHWCDQNGSVAAKSAVRWGRMRSEVVRCGN